MNDELIKMAIRTLTAEIEKQQNTADTVLARLYKERGRLRVMLGDKEGAMSDLREAIRLDPETVDSLRDGSFEGKIGGCH